MDEIGLGKPCLGLCSVVDFIIIGFTFYCTDLVFLVLW